VLNNFKTSFWKNTLVYGVGFLLLRGISFFLLPIYTNFLSLYEAGVVFIIYTILAFLNPIYAYGMNASLFKFYNNEDNNLKTVLSTSLYSVAISSFVFSLLIVLFSHNLDKLIDSNPENHINWFLYIAIVLFFDAISNRIFVVLRLMEKPFYFLFIGLINILLSLICNFIFIHYYQLASFGAVLALTVVSVVQCFVLLPIIINKINYRSIDYDLFKKMFSFALPFLPSALLFIVIGFSDRWFIKWYLDLHAVGLYGAGYKLGSIMGLAVTAFNLNWQPYYLKQKNNRKYKFGKIGSNIIIILIAVFTLLVLAYEYFIYINIGGYYLIGQHFWGGLTVVPFVALGYLFYGIYIINMPSLYLKNKQNWGLVFWSFGALINIAGNIALIPILGILGASIATAVAYFVMMAMMVMKNRVWLPIKFAVVPIAMISCISLLLIIIKFTTTVPFLLLLALVFIYLFTIYVALNKIKTMYVVYLDE